MKRFLRIITGVVAGLLGLAIGLLVLSRALGDHEVLYQGKSFYYWSEQSASPLPALSNRANAILNALIIPGLTNQMFSDTNDSAIRRTLVEQLNGLPGIHVDFTTGDARRVQAINHLAALGPKAGIAAPFLVEALKEDILCAPAAGALVQVHADPEVVIPALINCLVDRNGRGRADVVEALAEFGPKSRAAVPALVKLLQDRSSKDIMLAVPKALKQIDPQAAAEAGVK